jgi:Fe2+ transport system protein FeoA
MNGGYSSKDVCKFTGVTYRMLDHWKTRGFVTPSIALGEGTGNYRYWSFDDLLQIAVMNRLVKLGFNPTAAATVAADGHLTDGPVTVHVDRWAIRTSLVESVTGRPGVAA